MENALNHPKRSPLTLVGDAPSFLREAVGVNAAAQRLPTNNSYFILFADADADPEGPLFSSNLERLLALGIPADQIFLAYDIHLPEPALLHAFGGKLWVSAEESLEDLRHRLASALVAQRHRKLGVEIERAEKGGLAAKLERPEWLRRHDAAHLAHAISLALELNPIQHGQALRSALEENFNGAWRSDLSFEQAVAACAQLAIAEGSDPLRFREAFRRNAAALPSRYRTELRSASDRCLESIWRLHASVA
ncbi:MAG: hypothetical protein EOP11_08325 [Proteobacteria bacterium]|nr:MAG: hypothetical protein EOP11_08325 [Pseudomonadota bacterium]